MTVKQSHLMTYAALAGGAVLLYLNRSSVAKEVSVLTSSFAPAVPTADQIAALQATVATPAVAPQPQIIVAPASVSAADVATAVTAALNSAGYVNPATTGAIPGLATNSIPGPIQTPYGVVIPSNFSNPDLLPALVPAPQVNTTPVGTPANPVVQSSAQAQFANLLAAFAHNYYDWQNTIFGGSGSYNPASIQSYKNNLDNIDGQLTAMYSANPAIANGLNLSPWR